MEQNENSPIEKTIQEVREEASESQLFEMFKNEIIKTKGPFFEFRQTLGVFKAIPKNTPTISDIIAGEEIRKAIFLQAFMGEYFPKKEPGIDEYTARNIERINGSLGVEARRCMWTLEDFLALKPKQLLAIRNFGHGCYVLICERFEKLGFTLSDFPVFANYSDSLERVQAKGR